MVIMIILLILCLPLILMLSLFTTTSVVTVVADVPVTGIVLNMNKTEIPTLNLDKGDTIRVDYTVMPSGASNKDVTFSFSPIGEEKLAEFEVDGNLLVPTTNGKARVTVETVDGGFRDSFIIYVSTNRVTAIDSSPEREVITVGETTMINTLFTPKNATNQSLIYTVKEGEGIVKVVGGKIKGIGIGTAVIEVASGDKPEVRDEMVVTVVSSGTFDFIDDKSYATSANPRGSISVVLNPDITDFDYSITLADEAGVIDPKDVMNVSFNETLGTLEYEFTDVEFIGNIILSFTVTPAGGESVTKECSIFRIDEVEADWGGEWHKTHVVRKDEEIILELDVRPDNADVTYSLIATFTDNSTLSGAVISGEQIILEEGVEYVCNGGYMSFKLVGDVLIVKGLKTEGDDNDTATSIRLIVTDNSNGNTIKLRKKTIAVMK